MKQAKYIGMDVHQSTTVVAVLNADGRVVWETIVATEARAIIDVLERVSGSLQQGDVFDPKKLNLAT